MTEVAISVESVSKRFRLQQNRPASLKEKVTKRRFEGREEFWALRDVSLSVPRGSMFALVGHNGSGKSTMLRIIAGIYKPTSGRVVVDGRISALLELGAGFHPDLTGRENIYLNAAILGLTGKETDRLLDRIIDFSGIRDFIDTPVRHYSSGMYVRLGFSVAVHVDPQILLVDEIIAVGDEEFQRRCFDHLRQLRQRGTTILIVTHGLAVVQTMCDEAAWLDHGILRKVGSGNLVSREYLDEVSSTERDRIEQSLAAGGEPNESLLQSVELLDAIGQPASIVRPSDALRVRVCHSDQVGAVRVAIALIGASGVPVARVVSPPTEASSSGTSRVDMIVDRLPLGPGDYSIDVALLDINAMSVLEESRAVATLRVRPGDRRVEGIVDLEPRWEGAVPVDG